LGCSERIMDISIISYGKNSLDLRPTWVTTSPRERIEFVSQGSTVFSCSLLTSCVRIPTKHPFRPSVRSRARNISRMNVLSYNLMYGTRLSGYMRMAVKALALLRCSATLDDYWLPTFGTSYRFLEDGTDKVTRNIGDQLPTYAVQHNRRTWPILSSLPAPVYVKTSQL
jgi:hypothetical protein